jgi:uncharacterized protein YaaN involved in tellurite resistance
MVNDDTIKLLKECSAGIAMAVDAIDEILEDVVNDDLKAMLRTSKEKHQELEKDVNNYLKIYHDEPKEPPAMAKGMAHMKTNFKMTTKPSDETIADLITDGCNMGIKSLHRYLNQYKTADKDIRKIAEKLVHLESDLREDICAYL